jgi:hypothetical protein
LRPREGLAGGLLRDSGDDSPRFRKSPDSKWLSPQFRLFLHPIGPPAMVGVLLVDSRSHAPDKRVVLQERNLQIGANHVNFLGVEPW